MNNSQAKEMQALSYKATRAAHKAIGEVVEADTNLSEGRKIAAVLTSASVLYSSVLEGTLDSGDDGHVALIIGLFEDLMSANMAKLYARRQDDKKPN